MGNRLAGRNGGRLGVAALVAILLLGLGLRLGEAWDGRAPVYDASAYAAIAANLDRGDGFTVGPAATQPSSNYSPGLPLLLAGLYEVTGGVHERAARVLLALIGTLAVLFTYLIGRRLARSKTLGGHEGRNSSGVVAGLIGAAAVAIYPALLEYQGMTMGEPLATTLLAGAVLSIFWARDRGAPWRWLASGGLLGALTLVRPEYLAVSLLLAIVVFAVDARGNWRRALVQAAILLAGLVVVLA
ncbi:MAG: hypothetical protein QOI84_1790, partial [Solirubrobacterales bacterium]|nr:hypothetical protein [Solirubrobacterales bacterium]